MGYNVFISYSTSDIEYARLVQKAIRTLGFDAFLADNSLRAGENLAKIQKHIQASHLLIVLWSDAASTSEWVRDEVGAAWGAGKAVLPVHLTQGLALPPSLSGVKYLAAYTKDTASILDIQASVAAHWNLLVQQHEAQRAAWEAERQRKQAESNKQALGWLAIGGLALAAFSKG